MGRETIMLIHIHLILLVWAHVHRAFLWKIKTLVGAWEWSNPVSASETADWWVLFGMKIFTPAIRLITRHLQLTSQYPVVYWSHAVNYIVTVWAHDQRKFWPHTQGSACTLSWWMLTGSSSLEMSSAPLHSADTVCVCVCSLIPRPPTWVNAKVDKGGRGRHSNMKLKKWVSYLWRWVVSTTLTS